MSRLDDQLERDLPVIADRVTASPSPDAWAAIQQRIADREPTRDTEIIMLTDNTTPTRRWPIVAAAAAVAAVAVGAIALTARGDDNEIPAEPPPTVAPDGESTADPGGAPRELPDVDEQVPPGRYSTDALGTPVTFELGEGATAPWTLVAHDGSGIQLWSDDSAREFIAMGRIGSWMTSDEARDEEHRGSGSIRPDDIDGWIEQNAILVVDGGTVDVGARTAEYRRFRLDPAASAEWCPRSEQPCLWALAGSADMIDADTVPVPFARDRQHSLWLIDMDDFEPFMVLAIPNLADEDTWFADVVQPIVDSMTFGEPGPAVPGGTARVSTFESADAEASPLPTSGTLAPGTYSASRLGVPVTFDVPASSTWNVGINNALAFMVETDRGFWGMQRIGSFLDAEQAQNPNVPGLGSIPPDDFDGWIEANGVIVDERAQTTIGGYAADFRVVRAPEGSGADLCPAAAQPCIRVNSVSADAIEASPNDGSRIEGPLPNAYWMIELDEFEPIGIWAYAFDGDIDGWLDEIAPTVDSVTFGQPGPALEDGTARIPERVTVNASMTVDQTGERDAANPWPLERTGELTGDIVGTYTGTGISSPNAAEITLDWTMSATIDGIGSGTLTLRSYWYWSGDGATVTTDHVIGGTGDFAGWTGYGTGVQTSDDGVGNTFDADIELHLAPPTG